MEEENEKGFDISVLYKILFLFLRNWYWFVLSVIISYGVAYTVNRYSPSKYIIKSTLVAENRYNVDPSSVFFGASLWSSLNQMANEQSVINAYGTVEQALKNLDFGISYFGIGQVRNTELYKNNPFTVTIDSLSAFPYGKEFYISFNSPTSYSLFSDASFRKDSTTKNLVIGEQVDLNGFRFTVSLNVNSGTGIYNGIFSFRVNNLQSLLEIYRGRVKIEQAKYPSTLITLSIVTNTPAKDRDYLNEIVKVYSEYGLQKSNRVLENTIDFIDKQIQVFGDSLALVEKQMERFKQGIKGTDVGPMVQDLFNKVMAIEESKSEIILNRKFLEQFNDAVYAFDPYSNETFSPPILETMSSDILSLTSKMVELQLQRNSVIMEGIQKNPKIESLNYEIKTLKKTLLDRIQIAREICSFKIQELNNQLNLFNSQLRKLPKKEIEYININRFYKITEDVYQQMMEKRTEVQIKMAGNTSNITVLEDPYQTNPVFLGPNRDQNTLIAILVGLLIPGGILYLIQMLDSKIRHISDVISLKSAAILGTIPNVETENGEIIVKDSPKSVGAESFRAIRSNLQYFTQAEATNVFVVTSTVPGEGKTYSAQNLAYIFAISDKKTVLIGADMRKPNVSQSFGLEKHSPGLSSYLIDKATVDEVIQKTENDNLDIILSGPIPPNPAELLLKDSFARMLKELKERYDYIIIDTPPIGLVTDALLVSKFADATLYVIRENFSQKSYKARIEELANSGQVKNLSVILNGVSPRPNYGYNHNYNYGYGYSNSGYGYYGDEIKGKKPLWQRMFN